MFAFSTCWNSERHTDGRAMLAEVRALGFDHAELGHATRLSLLDGIQRAVAAKEIQIAVLHNFCPLPLGVNGPAPDFYMPSSRREGERALWVRHTLRTLDCAVSLQAKIVVLHLGSVPMRRYTRRLLDLFVAGKVATPRFERKRLKALTKRDKRRPKAFDNVCRCLDAVLPRARDAGIRLALETRLALEDIPSEEEVEELMRRYGDSTFGYWLDTAHAQIKENLGLLKIEAVLERFRGRTLGMHLQDFAPPVFDHLPPGKGTFDFGRLKPFLSADMVLSWEIHGEWEPEFIATETRRVHALLEPASA
jgi:sugar phosphate isomerase/epimerase